MVNTAEIVRSYINENLEIKDYMARGLINISALAREIIDKSFHKASNIVEPYFPKKETKIRKEVTDRISTIESISTGHLDKIIRKFPNRIYL